jgi:uncharacterized GH25 family protein
MLYIVTDSHGMHDMLMRCAGVWQILEIAKAVQPDFDVPGPKYEFEIAFTYAVRNVV